MKEIDFDAVNKQQRWGVSRSGKATARNEPFEASMLAWERIAEKLTIPQPTSSKRPVKVTKPKAPESPTAIVPSEGKHNTLPGETQARADGIIRGFVTLAGWRYYIPEIPVALPPTFHRQVNSKAGFKFPLIELRLEVPNPKHPAELMSYDLLDANEAEKLLQEHDACQNDDEPLAGHTFYAGSTSKNGDAGEDPEKASKTVSGSKQGGITEATKHAPKGASGGKQQASKTKPKQDSVSGTPPPTQERSSKVAAEQESTRTSPRLQEKARNAKQAQAEQDIVTTSKASRQPTSPTPESKASKPTQGRGKQSKRILGDEPTMGFEDDPDHPLRSPEIQKKPQTPPKKSSTKSTASKKPSATDQPEAPKKSSARPDKKPPTTKKATGNRSEPEQPMAPSKSAPKPSKKAAQKDNLSTSSDDLSDYIAKEKKEKVGKRKRAQQEQELEDAFIIDDEAPAKKKSKRKGADGKKK